MKNKRSALTKTRLKPFLEQRFIPPPSTCGKRKAGDIPVSPVSHSEQPSPKRSKFEIDAEEIDEITLNKLTSDCVRAEREVVILTARIQCLEKENRTLKAQNKLLSEKLQKCSVKRTSQALKRKEKSVILWKDKCRQLTAKQNKVHTLERKLQETKAREQRLVRQKRQRCYRKKKGRRQSVTPRERTETIKNLQTALYAAHETNKSLEDDLCTLQDELPGDADPEQQLSTMTDGKTFSPCIREASYKLQSLGVAESKVSEVIDTVVTTVAKKQLGPLPSTSTQRRLGYEMLALSRQQVRQ